jgi:ClpP class serine protease
MSFLIAAMTSRIDKNPTSFIGSIDIKVNEKINKTINFIQ